MTWQFPGTVRLPSGREVLASVVTLDMLVRLVPVVEVLAPLASLLSGTVADGTLAAVTTWTVYGVAFYLTAPVVYPEETGFPRENPGFKLLFAGVSVALGVGLVRGPSVTTKGIIFGTAMVAGGVGFVAYLRHYHGWRITHPRYPPVEPVELFTPFESIREEIKRDLARDGVLGAVGAGLWVTVFAGVLVVPAAIAAFVAAALAEAFPLFDLFVLGWIAADRLGYRSILPGAAGRRAEDPEARLFEQLGGSIRNLKGLFLVVFAVSGLLVSGGTVYVGVTVVTLFAEEAVGGATTVGWALFGIAICLSASGVYGLVVWYAQIRRIPPFVDVWVGNARAVERQPPMPPGTVLAPCMLVFAALGGAITIDLGVVRTAFWMGWPLALVGGLWGLAIWWSRDPTPVWAEDRKILRRLLIHSTVIWAFDNVATADAVIRGRRGPAAFVDPTYLTVIAMIVTIAYIPEVGRLDDPDRYPRLFVLPTYMLAVATVPMFAWIAIPGSFGTLFGMVVAVCVVSTIALLLIRRYVR